MQSATDTVTATLSVYHALVLYYPY